MTRADIEAAAEEKYPDYEPHIGDRMQYPVEVIDRERAAYIRGRLDQAEADAQIAKMWPLSRELADGAATTGVVIAAEIRKGVE